MHLSRVILIPLWLRVAFTSSIESRWKWYARMRARCIKSTSKITIHNVVRIKTRTRCVDRTTVMKIIIWSSCFPGHVHNYSVVSSEQIGERIRHLLMSRNIVEKRATLFVNSVAPRERVTPNSPSPKCAVQIARTHARTLVHDATGTINQVSPPPEVQRRHCHSVTLRPLDTRNRKRN